MSNEYNGNKAGLEQQVSVGGRFWRLARGERSSAFCVCRSLTHSSSSSSPQFAGLDLSQGVGPGVKYIPPHLRSSSKGPIVHPPPFEQQQQQQQLQQQPPQQQGPPPQFRGNSYDLGYQQQNSFRGRSAYINQHFQAPLTAC